VTDAFVIGAGFSAAASSHMPVMWKLARQLIGSIPASELRLPPNVPKDDFETWLTYLAADQPWLSERDNLLNRAAMLRVVQELRRVLDVAEERSRESNPPDWLLQLAARWHRDQSPVLTLNYDTIVEAAHLETVLVRSRGQDESNYVSYSGLYPIQISNAGSRSALVLGSSPYPTFKLFKLHGSVSWFYSGANRLLRRVDI